MGLDYSQAGLRAGFFVRISEPRPTPVNFFRQRCEASVLAMQDEPLKQRQRRFHALASTQDQPHGLFSMFRKDRQYFDATETSGHSFKQRVERVGAMDRHENPARLQQGQAGA